MVSIFWFRRDLRLEDNRGLYEALRGGFPVVCVFIFDKHILDDLEGQGRAGAEPGAILDRRLIFIHRRLEKLNDALAEFGSALRTYYDNPKEAWNAILSEFEAAAVYANRDYEPYAIGRDREVADLLRLRQIPFHDFKDQVIFEGGEVVKEDGKPYKIFTPYSRKWKARLDNEGIPSFPSEVSLAKTAKLAKRTVISLEEMGFADKTMEFPEATVKEALLQDYRASRDFPAKAGTSRLGIHLRFGTISIRGLVNMAWQGGSMTFLNELIWREFYMMILLHFPHVVHQAFNPKYDNIPWRRNMEDFEKWCSGKTGYPIVDAGMRELAATGYMHNRVRMITASFLTKHLLIDWRWGEAWFARHLLDYELASNNGGWQWAAGTGCDAAPYFRIFNPESQMTKFDKDMEYVKKWVPEYGTQDYPPPMVEHKFARERALRVYKSSLADT